jgi:hypothetical protein
MHTYRLALDLLTDRGTSLLALLVVNYLEGDAGWDRVSLVDIILSPILSSLCFILFLLDLCRSNVCRDCFLGLIVLMLRSMDNLLSSLEAMQEEKF